MKGHADYNNNFITCIKIKFVSSVHMIKRMSEEILEVS